MPGDRSTIASRREAIENAKKALIHDYIAQALERAAQDPGPKGRAALRQIRAIAKYL